MNTSSEAFLLGSIGQPNYAAAKAGIAALAVVAGGGFRGHEAGHHRVHPDSGPPFDGEAGDQVMQAGLGGAVGRGAR